MAAPASFRRLAADADRRATDARRLQAGLDQARTSVGVEGVHAVIFRGNINHVVDALSGNADARHIKRLRINLSINRERKHFPELRVLHILRSKNSLVKILPGPGYVVVPGKHSAKTLRAGIGT